jgi:2-polyprenyl-3-methyl-5-hydroxy-6-metoxy-1,4-benzoquinol methylase
VRTDELADLPEHNPVLITEDDLEDLATFTGRSREACLERLRAYSVQELARAWRVANPRTSEEILAFYRSTDLYIWALMQWHASPARQPYKDALTNLVQSNPAASGWKRVYDFGAGIGTDALYLSSRGYDVTMVDVDSPTFHFARHRFKRRNLHARFIVSNSPLPEPDSVYDVVVCFDVFEHLPDPLKAADRMVNALRSGGVFLQQGSFVNAGDHPCHLAEGVERFGGLKWQIHLARLGLRNVTGMVYRKGSNAERLLQSARYTIWRLSGLWVVRVPK